MADDDPHDLARFVAAQERVWADVRDELASGRKRSHWMWFVFPQLRGLGRSAMADRYGIASLAEARAYLAHPLLGERLRAATRLMLAADAGLSALAILGAPDDRKFHSSMTLFAVAAAAALDGADGDEARGVPDRERSHASGRGAASAAPFEAALARFFDGERDAATLALLGRR